MKKPILAVSFIESKSDAGLEMPMEINEQVVSSMNQQIEGLPGTITDQMMVSYVKNEYEALGLNMDSIQIRYILATGIKMLGYALLGMLASISVVYLSSKISALLGRDLRGMVFKKVLSFSNAEFDQFSTASLITRSTNDIQQIQGMFVMLIRILFYAPILGIGGVLKVFNTNTSMAWIIGVAVAAIMIIIGFLFAVVIPKFKLLQKLVDKVNLVTREILTDISFQAKPGETIAFIGSTGSGKSTLINLIPRFYDVTKGRILIDGVDIREIKLTELRDKLGLVPQKGVLFSGTIESNVKFGNEKADEAELERAARIAQALEFVKEKPEGFDSEISQGGNNVSGGQKQRLSIARAIAKNPDIYIFDDSFSALDYKTDVALRAALKKEIKDSTVLIVAQRISTILNADQIIVLDEGKLAGIGTHKELLKTSEIYRQIAMSQLSEKELGINERELEEVSKDE